MAGNPDVTVDSVNSGCRNTRSLMSCDRVHAEAARGSRATNNSDYE